MLITRRVINIHQHSVGQLEELPTVSSFTLFLYLFLSLLLSFFLVFFLSFSSLLKSVENLGGLTNQFYGAIIYYAFGI